MSGLLECSISRRLCRSWLRTAPAENFSTLAIAISPSFCGGNSPSARGLKYPAKLSSVFSRGLMCHTRYGSSCENSHRPCGLILPKGRDPSGLPAADKTRLPSVGAAAPNGTPCGRSCPLGFLTDAVRRRYIAASLLERTHKPPSAHPAQITGLRRMRVPYVSCKLYLAFPSGHR